MKRLNTFWVYALVLALFVALIVWRMQRQAAADDAAAPASADAAAAP